MKTLLILFLFVNLDELLKTGLCAETRDEVLSITAKTREQVDILRNVSTQHETVLWQPDSPENITEETEVHLCVPANSSETVRALLQTHAMCKFSDVRLDELLKTGLCAETRDEVLSITAKTREQVDILRNVSTQHETVLCQPDSPENITEETEVHLFVPANSSETVRALLQTHAITHEVRLANARELSEIQTRNESTDARSSSSSNERQRSLKDVCSSPLPVCTGLCAETRDEVLSITAKTREQVDILRNVSTQHETVLWQPDSPENIAEETEVHLFVPANSSETVRALLRTHAITHEVLLANARELIELQTRNESTDPRSSSSFYERYHSLDDIYYWMNTTQLDNPNTVKLILIGSSYEKRPLYVMKLSLNDRPNKKAMWIDCGIHAREWISPAFCLWFVQYSLSFYNENEDITHILNNMDVYVLPVMNPDGYEYTWTTKRMWRKNRSANKLSGCMGVDLNRNFDANWCTEGASSDPCSETYCGAHPESEPESMAVTSFLRSHKDIVQIYLSIHSYSQMLLFPFSYTFEEAENHNDLLAIAEEAAQKIRRHYRSIYKYGPGAKTIYLSPGGSDDWAYNLGIKYAFTFELQDRGRYGFLLPPSHISNACNEALLAVKTVATKVIEKTQAPTSAPELEVQSS